MEDKLDILILEDVPADADAIEFELRKDSMNFRTRRLDSRKRFLEELDRTQPHLILSDFTMGKFNAMEALRLLKETNRDIPFILVTGTRSEEVAVECIREGADDYILKSSLKRLPTSIRSVLKKKAEERKRKNSEEALRALPRLIRDAQEIERRRVARELHDGVIQILSSIKFRMHAIEERLTPRATSLKVDVVKTVGLLDRAIDEVRQISRNLLPSELEDLGLGPAVRSMSLEFAERSGIGLNLELGPLPEAISAERILNVYRIVQEGLANVEKHSRAQKVQLELRYDAPLLHVLIQDDGCGFSGTDKSSSRGSEHRGMGLVDIQERTTICGGQCAITSNPNQGTTIRISIPATQTPLGSERKD